MSCLQLILFSYYYYYCYDSIHALPATHFASSCTASFAISMPICISLAFCRTKWGHSQWWSRLMLPPPWYLQVWVHELQNKLNSITLNNYFPDCMTRIWANLTTLLFYLRWVFQEMGYGQCRASLCPLPANTQHFNIYVFYFFVSLILNTALCWRTYSIDRCRGFRFSHHGGVAHCPQERSLLEWQTKTLMSGGMFRRFHEEYLHNVYF